MEICFAPARPVPPPCGFVSDPGCGQICGSTAAVSWTLLRWLQPWGGRATACPPSVSAACAGLFAPPRMPLPDTALSLLPLEIFSALCCSHEARWVQESFIGRTLHPWAGHRCTVPAGTRQPSASTCASLDPSQPAQDHHPVVPRPRAGCVAQAEGFFWFCGGFP